MALLNDASITGATRTVSKIRNALRWLVDQAVANSLFEKVIVDPDTGATSIGAAETRLGFSANETSAQTAEPGRRRDVFLVREIELYTWDMILEFPGWVTTELFDNLLRGEAIIPADSVNGIRQLTITLQSIDWNHPPVHASETGSRVQYTFQVVPGRA